MLGRDRWTPDQANNWFNSQKYIMGSEYMASYAVNQLKMFQAETFDADTIDKELEVYGKLGMTTIRVFMHDIPYTIDPAGFARRSSCYKAIERYNFIIKEKSIPEFWP